MKHLIVVAHPAETSFTMGLARAYAAEIEALGHSQKTCDLYRMKFDPVLHRDELLPPSADNPIPADVAEAQADLRSADVLSVFYPLWWMAMPAILKGYIDRVFARGFAFESKEGEVRGLLAGKRAVVVTVSGAPLPVLAKAGKWNALEVLQDTHIFRGAGFDLLEHLHFDEVVPHLLPTIGTRDMKRVRACARQHFSAGLAMQPETARRP